MTVDPKMILSSGPAAMAFPAYQEKDYPEASPELGDS